MATVMEGAVQAVIESRIDTGIHEARLAEDPVWMDVIKTSLKVQKDPRGMGRDWLVTKVFGLGFGGAYRYMTATGGNELSTNLTHVAQLDTPRTYPDHTEHTHSNYLTLSAQLIKGMGNLFVDTTVLRANELNATIGDVVAFNIRGAASRISRADTAAFYSTNETNALNVLGVLGTSVTESADTLTFNLSSGRIRNFFPGQHIEIWDTGGDIRRHADDDTLSAGTEMLIVDSVDPVGGTIIARLSLSTSTFDTTPVTGDLVIAMRDPSLNIATVGNEIDATSPLSPYGINDAIKGSGTLFNENGQTGISLTTYPQFKSVTGTLTSYLTDEDFNKYFGGFEDAYGGLADIDTIITTNGVLNGYMVGTDGQGFLERNNMTRKVRSGWSVFTFTLGGKEIELKVSPNVESGALFALALRNGNWKQYVPPSLPGAGSDSRFDGAVEFVNKAYGPSIFKPYHVSSATSEVAEAPFEDWKQWLPDSPQGIKLSSITESAIV